MATNIAQWRSDYETGYTLIDDQHKSLFNAINALHNAMLEGHGEDLLEKTLNTLKDYTTLHFETEERFMAIYEYPDYAEHKAKHEDLKAKVFGFADRQEQNTALKAIEVSRFLTDWLIHHIKSEDQRMIRFLREHKGEAPPHAYSDPS